MTVQLDDLDDENRPFTFEALRDRDRKLDEHDRWAYPAVELIRSWLVDEPRLLVAVARGRHAEGSLRYGDKLMYEYTQDELLAEASQELGDAINYLALYLAREERAA